MTDRWEHIDDEACRSFRSAVELVGQRWSSGILLALAQGATRFSEIQERVSGLSARLLTVRLKELAAAGLVERTVIPTMPVQVRYALTTKGSELMDVLGPLVEWEQRWSRQPSKR